MFGIGDKLGVFDQYKRNSIHRRYVDDVLETIEFTGRVLDVGGRKFDRRGFFTPASTTKSSWEYLNIDAGTKPDHLGSADNIPISDGTFDMVLLSEVLEHLERPTESLREIFRVIKNGGRFHITVPFLFPVHACPYDFQRWTPDKLNLELQEAGFKVVEIRPLAGYYGIIHDLSKIYLTHGQKNRNVVKRVFARVALKALDIMHFAIYRIDFRSGSKDRLCSGFYVHCVK